MTHTGLEVSGLCTTDADFQRGIEFSFGGACSVFAWRFAHVQVQLAGEWHREGRFREARVCSKSDRSGDVQLSYLSE